MERYSEPHIITFPKIEDPRGNLSFIEDGRQMPFAINRAYWIYDIPSGRVRHGRALYTCAELIMAVSGQCTVSVDDGRGTVRDFTLNRSNEGLYLPPLTWRTITDFVTSTTCLVLASKLYDEADYIRDYNLFKAVIADEMR